jgi:DNA-binding CsgD family transcriptional regulator
LRFADKASEAATQCACDEGGLMRLVLSEADQVRVRALSAAEPVPGEPLPRPDVLRTLAGLIPCDGIGADVVDRDGRVQTNVSWPRCAADPTDLSMSDAGPFVGIVRLAVHPAYAAVLLAIGLTDCLAMGFKHGPARIAQLHLDRLETAFTERDVACLTLVSPAIQRLLRERPDPSLPEKLTPREQRVLRLLAAGYANAEIAELLFVAPSTIRKHLEHAYRKLGVTNRMAAAARLPVVRAVEAGERPDEFA